MDWKKLPLRQKLMTVLLVTSGAVLVLASASFSAYEYLTIRKGLLDGYLNRAQIIAVNSTAALAFQNQKDAEEVLAAFKADNRVIGACLYDNRGKVFATYPAAEVPSFFPTKLGTSGYGPGRLEVYYPVVQGDRALGTVYVRTDLSALTDRYKAYAWLAGLVLLSSILLAYLLSRILQKQISEPLLALAETARLVSDRRDFSVRARKFGEDELGLLTDDFNRMLAEIQTQNEAITKLNTGLEQRIAERTAELEATTQEVQSANKKLRELDKLKTEFFSNVSHELRTPLTLILAPLEDILGSTAISVSQRETLQMVHNNAVRLLQMVNGLLDFSKLSAEKMQVKRERTQVRDLTRSLFRDFKPVLDQKGIRGELAVDIYEPYLEMDRYLYERILFNLVSNAVKFTPRGGEISLSAVWDDGKLTLTVTDTGIGISPEDQKNLFQRFHQAEGSSTRRFEGTGLGLAMVKEFAQLLGGSVSVKSNTGKGSVFAVVLEAPKSAKNQDGLFDIERKDRSISSEIHPLVMGQLSEQEPILPTGKRDLPKVLVAEDNPELAQFICKLLWDCCEVKIAADGEEALALVRKWDPDLVLSDVMMPKMDGLQLTKAIKQDKETAAIPVVLLTAMTGREDLMKGWEVGADDYLFKPFHPKELEARIRSILSMLDWKEKSQLYRRQRDALEQFTHIASHDLREPLRKIVSFTRLFEDKVQERLDDESKGYLNVITRSSMRMVDLLDSLMEYSRIDKESPAVDNADLNGVLKRVLEGYAVDIQKYKVKLTVGVLPSLRAVPGQIELVFQNLIGNSLKYRSDTSEPTIKIGAVQKGSEWVFSVEDNGIGFDPAYAEKIFIMFERLHGQEKYKGDGMGLAITRKIVENHGGRIWAESKPGKGSIFYFTLLNGRNAQDDKAGMNPERKVMLDQEKKGTNYAE